MDTFMTMVRNWFTTVAGLVAGAGYYLNTAGLTIPSTRDQAKAFIIGLATVALGVGAKDASK